MAVSNWEFCEVWLSERRALRKGVNELLPRFPHVTSDKNKIGARSVHGKVLSGREFRENRRSHLHLRKKMLLRPPFPHFFQEFDGI